VWKIVLNSGQAITYPLFFFNVEKEKGMIGDFLYLFHNINQRKSAKLTDAFFFGFIIYL
tara:strand:+ start:169 stop:345 length:177 start_codon:yes stop_codon:yes gene_type:complete